MSYEKAQGHFKDIRARLYNIMPKDGADRWLADPHPALGSSPARAIHSGKMDDVKRLVDKLEGK